MNDTAIRDARDGDLAAFLRLLGQLNETQPPLGEGHRRALEAIAADARQRLLVIEHEGAVVGTASIVVVPNIGHGGRPYALVENVVIDAASRGQGLGERLMRYVIDEARAAGCYKVALTSRKTRTHAHRFYERLGFMATSTGFRVEL